MWSKSPVEDVAGRLRRILRRHELELAATSRRAEAVRGLAALLRSGAPPRSALTVWHIHAPLEMETSLHRLSRRLRLGAPLEVALDCLRLDFGDDLDPLTSTFAVQAKAGGDAASMLDGLARTIDERAAWLGAARAAGSGAMLSGRMVAGLPLAFVPLMPVAHAGFLDRFGATMAALGIALAVAGMRWIGTLVPRPPQADDATAAAADATASLLRGGAPLRVALEVAAQHSSRELQADMQRAHRRVVLGASWPDALNSLEDSPNREALGSLAATLAAAETMGLPVAGALEAYAERRRALRARSLEAQMKRAPVLMVIPLVLCVLPSFVILALGPFLRGLSLA